MYLTRHQTDRGIQWAVDDRLLPPGVTLAGLLALPASTLPTVLESLPRGDNVGPNTPLLTPVEPTLEVWGSGVTYMRSRQAREHESATADVYQKVYDAPRPELFFKSSGWRVVGSGDHVRIRKDTRWNVPEPELTLVINAHCEIVGYAIGNDMSSRDIEGENPLYLPQAKTYNGACAVGPGISLTAVNTMEDLTVQLKIERGADTVFTGDTSTNNMKRSLQELAEYLYRELDFPNGTFLMTGTGVVPPDDFSLATGDVISVVIGGKTLENAVA